MDNRSLFDERVGPTELLGGPASARLWRGAIEHRVAASAFEALHADIEWQDCQLVVFGRKVRQPRLVAWCSDANRSYSYSGLTLNSIPMHPTVLDLRSRCEELAGQSFDSVLLNLYRDGDDCVSWHSDDERLFGRDPIIASLSLGATRRFDFRNRDSGARVSEDVMNGDLVVMSGACQRDWEHQVPRQRRVRAARINLTFRRVV